MLKSKNPFGAHSELFFIKRRFVVVNIILATIVSSTLIISSAAFAHAKLDINGATPPRYDNSNLKISVPCGNESSYPNDKTNRVSIFKGGETIVVSWLETTNHVGMFYVDFSTTDINGPYTNVATKQDTGSATSWEMSYTLPNATCTDCKLRLRQDMGNANISGHYFSCADVILVSGNDLTAPSNSTNVTTTVSDTDIKVVWSNPTDDDYKSTIVVRGPTTLSAGLEDRKDYLAADLIGNGVVVYKGNAAQFSDTGLQAMTSYIYTVYSYDNDYNYNSGAATSAITGQISTGGGSGGSGGDTNSTTGSSDSGGGALFVLLLIALGLVGIRRMHRGL